LQWRCNRTGIAANRTGECGDFWLDPREEATRYSPEQKSEMIHQLTETMVRIEGENLRPVTWVSVEEVKSGDWGIGGKRLTAADVHALQGKAPAGVPG
jgi:4-oxalocrotonate tautomerase